MRAPARPPPTPPSSAPPQPNATATAVLANANAPMGPLSHRANRGRTAQSVRPEPATVGGHVEGGNAPLRPHEGADRGTAQRQAHELKPRLPMRGGRRPRRTAVRAAATAGAADTAAVRAVIGALLRGLCGRCLASIPTRAVPRLDDGALHVASQAVQVHEVGGSTLSERRQPFIAAAVIVAANLGDSALLRAPSHAGQCGQRAGDGGRRWQHCRPRLTLRVTLARLPLLSPAEVALQAEGGGADGMEEACERGVLLIKQQPALLVEGEERSRWVWLQLSPPLLLQRRALHEEAVDGARGARRVVPADLHRALLPRAVRRGLQCAQGAVHR